jgi:hypothetical protein
VAQTIARASGQHIARMNEGSAIMVLKDNSEGIATTTALE